MNLNMNWSFYFLIFVHYAKSLSFIRYSTSYHWLRLAHYNPSSLPSSYRNGQPRPFVYVLLCEYGSILHPSNTVQALDMCERMRVRNCGHVALYQVLIDYNDKLRVFAADDWQKMKCLPSMIFLSAADKMLAKDSPLTLWTFRRIAADSRRGQNVSEPSAANTLCGQRFRWQFDLRQFIIKGIIL